MMRRSRDPWRSRRPPIKIVDVKTFLMQAGSPPGHSWATDSSRPTLHDEAGRPYESRGRNWLFLKVLTDEGVAGVGECSGWPRVVETAVNDLKHVIIDQDPMHIERLWHRMMSVIMHHGISGVVGGGAMSGIDMALWDIKGKVLNTPVWNLLGGRMRHRVRLYGHASTPEVALSLKERGFTAVKTGGLAEPMRKVEAIRRAVGDDMDVMVDLYGPPWMTAKDAIVLGKALEPFSLLFIEDPVPPENLDGLRRVRDAVAIPVAAGERLSTLWGLRPLIEGGAVDVVQPDTGRAGGISQLRKIAALAEAHFVSFAPHSGTLGPVAEFAALHVLAALPNGLILERIEDDWAGRYEVVTPVLKSMDGHLPVPDGPGLGVDLVEDAIAKYPSARNIADPDAGGAGTTPDHAYFTTRFGRRGWFTPDESTN